jgi:hypothetical protein
LSCQALAPVRILVEVRAGREAPEFSRTVRFAVFIRGVVINLIGPIGILTRFIETERSGPGYLIELLR